MKRRCFAGIVVDTLESRRMLSSEKTGHGPGCGCPFCAGMNETLAAKGLPAITCGSETPTFLGNQAKILGSDPQEYQLNNRWTTTATNGSTVQGQGITLTWGFVADGLTIPSGGVSGEVTAPSSLRASLNSIYGNMATWQPIFQSAFDAWTAVTGVSYQYVTYDDGAVFPGNGGGGSPGVLNVRPDVRIGGHPLDGAFNVLAYNYFPNVGDMVIDTNEFGAGGLFLNTSNNNIYLFNTITHEHGHGLGLNHTIPLNNTKLMEPQLSIAFRGPQFDDILGAQVHYGDVYEKGVGNNTAANASILATVSAAGSGVLATSVSTTTANADFYRVPSTGDRRITLTLTPQGGSYQQGPQNGAASTFNASAQGDLVLQLVSSDGAVTLLNANATAVGGTESFTFEVPAGTNYVRVAINSGSPQSYSLSQSNVAVTRGDLNNDGVINNNDIAAFVLALTDPATYATTYPTLNSTLRGDVSFDGVLNNADIAPFVALLTGGRPGALVVPPAAGGSRFSETIVRGDDTTVRGAVLGRPSKSVLV